MNFTATALLLFLVLDPLGNVPLYLSQLRALPERRRLRVAMRELGIAYLVLVFFFFAGAGFMRMLALDMAAMRIAGGVVLFLIALRMVFPMPDAASDMAVHGEPLVVPLAVPAVAGPGALSVVLLLREVYPDATFMLFCALSAAWLVSAVILAAAPLLQRLLRDAGLVAMERLMGLVLVVMSVQMFLDALRALGAIPAVH